MVVLMNMETGEVERAPLIEATQMSAPAAGHTASWPPLQARLAEVCAESRPVVRPWLEPVDELLARMAMSEASRHQVGGRA